MSDKNARLDEEALAYHFTAPAGKLEVVATKPLTTQRDLALAYSPGVAAPCTRHLRRSGQRLRIHRASGNMVAVISNGTAVLGLGNLGALASKPVMEGKAVLFKRFADVTPSIWSSTPKTRTSSSMRPAARAVLRRHQP